MKFTKLEEFKTIYVSDTEPEIRLPPADIFSYVSQTYVQNTD
jgi:hypothetical protein